MEYFHDKVTTNTILHVYLVQVLPTHLQYH